MPKTTYKRILLKLSGESLKGHRSHGVDPDSLDYMAGEIKSVTTLGIELGIVTNDLVTREDANRLKAGGLVSPDHIIGVECGACPHTVIREDPTLNIEAVDSLERQFPSLSLILLESGGDNLASTFSLDLVDWWMFVIDVGAGNDIPRKRGPCVLQCDLFVINKVDIAPYVRSESFEESCSAIRTPVLYHRAVIQ